MIWTFYDLFPEEQSAYGREHDKANWGLCGVGDVVKLPNIFSYRVVYFKAIMKDARNRANSLGCDLQIHQEGGKTSSEGDFICFMFRGLAPVGEPLPHYTKLGPNGNWMSCAPRHCGTEVSKDECVNIGPNYGYHYGYFGSINFYPEGEPQPSEDDWADVDNCQHKID